MVFPPIFVVNLRKNADRMESIKRQLDGMGLAYERFDAVYGRDLPCQERQEKFSKWRSRLAIGADMTDGELGCALSHLGIYKKMFADGHDMAIVLEDDVLVDASFPDAVKRATDFATAEQPQVILFSAYGEKKGVAHEAGVEKIAVGSCADGYLVTRAAAKLISEINLPVIVQADAWARWRRRYGLQLYRIYPTSVRQDNDNFGTDIDGWTDSNRKVVGNGTGRTGLDLIAFRIRRVFEKSIDWTLWKLGL